MQTKTLQDVTEVVYVFVHRQLSETARMQAIGHQVVGSENKSHEDVKLMYEKFFGGEAVRVKRELKKQMGLIQARAVLHQIFQVLFCVLYIYTL